MNIAVYLSLRNDKTFHTIIIKKEIKEFTYMAAVGYAGGQVYGEFYAKLKYDDNHNITGLFSNSTGSVTRERIPFNDELFSKESLVRSSKPLL